MQVRTERVVTPTGEIAVPRRTATAPDAPGRRFDAAAGDDPQSITYSPDEAGARLIRSSIVAQYLRMQGATPSAATALPESVEVRGTDMRFLRRDLLQAFLEQMSGQSAGRGGYIDESV